MHNVILSVHCTDGGVSACVVRRACYSVQSAAGRGASWEWASGTNYCPVFEPLPMDVSAFYC